MTSSSSSSETNRLKTLASACLQAVSDSNRQRNRMDATTNTNALILPLPLTTLSSVSNEVKRLPLISEVNQVTVFPSAQVLKTAASERFDTYMWITLSLPDSVILDTRERQVRVIYFWTDPVKTHVVDYGINLLRKQLNELFQVFRKTLTRHYHFTEQTFRHLDRDRFLFFYKTSHLPLVDLCISSFSPSSSLSSSSSSALCVSAEPVSCVSVSTLPMVDMLSVSSTKPDNNNNKSSTKPDNNNSNSFLFSFSIQANVEEKIKDS